MVRLFDCHAHTSDLSYCCEPGITPEHYAAALDTRPDLCGIAITNHGFAAYFPADLAWSAAFILQPGLFDDYRAWGNRRLEQHLARVECLRDRGLCTGIEVEIMNDGRLTVDPRLRPRLEVVIGSVHFMPDYPARRLAAMAPDEIIEVWWQHTVRLAGSGIDILGHPFRWLTRVAGQTLSPALVERTVTLAARCGIALEINAHAVIPGDVALLHACVQAAVPVAFGSDSHSLPEAGRLDYHLELLAAAQLTPEQVPLWLPPRLR